MQLYVSSVSNLTDARFFSAYGVQYFGFCFDALNPNAITTDKARAIISWLHEPKIIGQFGEHQRREEMQYVDSQVSLSGVQITPGHPEMDKIEKPKWIATEKGILEENTTGIYISALWTKELLEHAVSQQPYGIHISSSGEESPGSSNVEYYAELMEILAPHLVR